MSGFTWPDFGTDEILSDKFYRHLDNLTLIKFIRSHKNLKIKTLLTLLIVDTFARLMLATVDMFGVSTEAKISIDI